MSIELGLERLENLVAHLPPYTRPTIHIAGTNGKGSVSALLTSILLASPSSSSFRSLRIGRYNSPHLVSILDCITIDNKPISRSLYDQTRKEVEEADQKYATHLSNFELLTMTALLAFEHLGVDIVVLEVGMGGRLDATNIVPTSCILVSVLTAVDLDHQAFLGDTVVKIAREKVGIARAGKPFVLGKQAHPEVDGVVKEVIEDIGGLLCPPVLVEKDNNDDSGFSLLPSQNSPTPHSTHSAQLILSHIPCFPSATLRASLPLHGAHQLDNLATALTVINAFLTYPLDPAHQNLGLKSRITLATIAEGIRNVSWPGRLSFHTINIQAKETNRVDTLLILADGAHNPASAQTLGAFTKSLLESTVKALPSAAPLSKSLPITYIIGLSHSPPKTPLETLAPLFGPIQPSDLTSTLNIQPAVAVLPFTPPEGMPWVKPVPAETMREVVTSLLPSLAEHDIWVPGSGVGRSLRSTDSAGEGSRNEALEDALRWAAGRHSTLAEYREDEERVPGLVVLAGSLYLVADFYRLIEGGALGV